jgi:hypothetical protein
MLEEIRQRCHGQENGVEVSSKGKPWCSPRSKEEKEKEDSNPETTTTGDCNSVKDVPKDLATLVSSSADDTGVPAVSLTPALSARLTSEAW